jgi:hypothetical protein
MIKYIFSSLFAAFFFLNMYASGDLDRVDIYLNGRLISTWTVSGSQEIHLDTLHGTDTLWFYAWTNFDEGLRNATLDIRDNSGILISHINSSLSTNFEAHFMFILKPEKLDLSTTKILQAVITLAPEQDVQTIPIANISMPDR